MSDDRVSWFESHAVKAEHIRGPYLHLFFLQFRTRIKKNVVFFIFLTSPVLEMFNLFEIL